MRRGISIGELKRYYNGRSLSRILFCTENQAWDRVENPLKASLVFSSMLIASNPNVICLKCGDSSLWLEKVKVIYVDAGRSPLGTVLDIVCGDYNSNENDIKYTLITV